MPRLATALKEEVNRVARREILQHEARKIGRTVAEVEREITALKRQIQVLQRRLDASSKPGARQQIRQPESKSDSPAEGPSVAVAPGSEAIVGKSYRPMAREDAKRCIERRTIEFVPDEEMLTTVALAARMHLKSSQSIRNRLHKGALVGWQGAGGGFVYPARQLDERGRPIAGLDQVLSLFDDPCSAWFWLTTEKPSCNNEEPLTLLRRGDFDLVIAAARGDLQGDFA